MAYFQTIMDVYKVTLASGPSSFCQWRTIGVPLSPKSKLEWVSFSSAGNIVMMDSKFIVRLLSNVGVWNPILDGETLLKNPEDAIWPIAVREFPGPQIRYLYCKTSRYPKPTKNLSPSIDTWKLPLCSLVRLFKGRITTSEIWHPGKKFVFQKYLR